MTQTRNVPPGHTDEASAIAQGESPPPCPRVIVVEVGGLESSPRVAGNIKPRLARLEMAEMRRRRVHQDRMRLAHQVRGLVEDDDDDGED